jgi:hypothetical protein
MWLANLSTKRPSAASSPPRPIKRTHLKKFSSLSRIHPHSVSTSTPSAAAETTHQPEEGVNTTSEPPPIRRPQTAAHLPSFTPSSYLLKLVLRQIHNSKTVVALRTMAEAHAYREQQPRVRCRLVWSGAKALAYNIQQRRG